jgi:hypothetical protein
MAIITNLQPPAGTPVENDTVISFDVIDPVVAELQIFSWVVFRATGQVELAYDGSNFQPLYSFSTIEGIPGGRRFSLRRVGGWPSQPEVRVDSCACPPEIAPPAPPAPTSLRFDNRASPASVSSSKTFNWTIDTGGMTTPLMQYLRVNILALPSTTADIRAWTDAGLTNLVYEATGRTVGGAVGHRDGTPAALFNSSAIGSGQLTGGLLYVQADLPAFLDSPVTGNLYLVATEAPIFGS